MGRALAANPQYGDAEATWATVCAGKCGPVSVVAGGAATRSTNGRIEEDG
jgi:hypothetical protein